MTTAATRVIARALRIRSAELHRDTPRVAQLSPAAEAAVQRIVANEMAELAALIRDPPDKDRARAAGELPEARRRAGHGEVYPAPGIIQDPARYLV